VFGTWESTRVIESDETESGGSEQRVVEFVGEVNEAFPGVGLTPADVTLVHRGAVPARVDRSGGVHLEGREQVRTHEEQGIDGLITVAGTKYTTARAVAERIVNAVFSKLEREPEPCRTAVRPLLPVPEQALHEEVPSAETVPQDDLQSHLLASYGLRYDAVLNLCDERPDWGARVSDDSPVIAAELVWAVRHEMALNLVDALVRRTPLGTLGDPGEAVTERAADILGSELKWTDGERRRNIDEVRRFYRLRAI
jgi:glycerol-3-phosphate dehydrogenase